MFDFDTYKWVDYTASDAGFDISTIYNEGVGLWAVCIVQHKGQHVGVIKWCDGRNHANEVADTIRRAIHCPPYKV